MSTPKLIGALSFAAALWAVGPPEAQAAASRPPDHSVMRGFHPAYEGLEHSKPARGGHDVASVPELDPAGLGSVIALLGSLGALYFARPREAGEG